MSRRTLPNRRTSENFALLFWNQDFVVTVGYYANGDVGEVFIDGGKTGQDAQFTARDAAIAVSIAIQYGVPIEALKHALTRPGDGAAASILGAITEKLSTACLSVAESQQ
jgi:hypothetical protein